MILKIVSLFLIVMLVLGMFGKLRLRLPRIGGLRRTDKLAKPKKCSRCGRFLIGQDSCDCKRG